MLTASDATTMAELVRAGALLASDFDAQTLCSVLVEQSLDVTGSDLACLYLLPQPAAEREQRDQRDPLRLVYRRGDYPVADSLAAADELVAFLWDCGEAVVQLTRDGGPFSAVLLCDEMASGVALPLITAGRRLGVLIVNSRQEELYRRERFQFLDSFVQLAAGMLHNARLFAEQRESLRRIQELERYQESIFSSMTNLLVATDERGRVRYCNRAARERLGLSTMEDGADLRAALGGGLDEAVLASVDATAADREERLGIEGIFRPNAGGSDGSDGSDGGHESSRDQPELDFSLNVSPLRGPRGGYEGVTLLFTDQTRERELQSKVRRVTEDRRVIKDMFSRYLSREIVQRLVDQPELIKPGGDSKEATILFADIRGYTSFSEGRPPEQIIEILNDYFSEAVEIVIKHRGYIDKFIGDSIMAAWGVPIQSVDEDARAAVACAVEIQQLVRSTERSFFTGDAEGLTIGIGMHTGPIVAGNLGSTRRMNYTVIGDTVNVAARLESVAGPGEVIITESTQRYVRDHFEVRRRKAVTVKGKKEPIKIFKVLAGAA